MKITLLSLLILFSTSVHSEDILDIAAKYTSKKVEVSNVEDRRRKILADIFEIEKETRSLLAKKSDLDEQKAQLDHRLAKISNQIVSIETKLGEITPDLIERMTFMGQIKDLPWFYAFMTSQSVGELDQLYQAAENINKSQSEQLRTFIGLHQELNREKEDLTKTAREIVGLKKNIVNKEHHIEKNQKAKNKILKNVDLRLASQKKSLRFLKMLGRSAVKRSEFKNLGLLFGVDFFEKKGQLDPPIKAPVSQPYGLIKKMSLDSVELMSKGLFFTAESPSSVTSVASGRARFVGSIPGFGTVVILDHGGRYYSVYGNLKESKVTTGQVINPQQIVGVTGHEHLLFKQGLYFEIRHFSQPQDPGLWLKKIDQKLATL